MINLPEFKIGDQVFYMSRFGEEVRLTKISSAVYMKNSNVWRYALDGIPNHAPLAGELILAPNVEYLEIKNGKLVAKEKNS